ncbi:MAG: hypothetical protein Q8R28_00620 [Dehalococcoidia bacterium]|nr:hypothetical protein [Dehalococcoidia bacterium]
MRIHNLSGFWAHRSRSSTPTPAPVAASVWTAARAGRVEVLLCGDCISICPLDAWRAARTGYCLYVGGKVGRHPRMATRVAEFLAPEAVPDIVEGIVALVAEKGSAKERFGVVLERVGLTALVETLSLREAACVVSQPSGNAP